jgi:hypothetical protein
MLPGGFVMAWKPLEMLGSVLHDMQHDKALTVLSEMALSACIR